MIITDGMDENVAKNALFDDDAFSLRLLKYAARFDSTLNALRENKVKPDDFINGEKGIKIYQEAAKLVFEFTVSPIDADTFNVYFKAKEKEGTFKNYHATTINDTFDELLGGETTDTERVNIEAMIRDFVVRRRTQKVLQKKAQNAEWVRDQLNTIFDERRAINVGLDAEFFNPFETMVESEARTMYNMGMGQMDTRGSIGPEECGLIIGHSGTGKTAVASFMMHGVAINGRKVLYITAEEPACNIVNRWYARQFQMNYSELYRGNAETKALKREKWDALDDDEREQLKRLQIVDVRNITTLNVKAIAEVLEKKADAGFIPDVICIDQMDYLRPMRAAAKNSGKWQDYENIAFDCDWLSQYKIGGTYPIALWVLHQATGDMKWEFTYNDIAGFKGIVKPFDVAVGIGREDRESNHVNIFSLKVRHSEHFRSPQLADFKHMTFIEDLNYKTKVQREKEGKKVAGGKKKAANPVADVDVVD